MDLRTKSVGMLASMAALGMAITGATPATAATAASRPAGHATAESPAEYGRQQNLNHHNPGRIAALVLARATHARARTRAARGFPPRRSRQGASDGGPLRACMAYAAYESASVSPAHAKKAHWGRLRPRRVDLPTHMETGANMGTTNHSLDADVLHMPHWRLPADEPPGARV